MSIRHKLFVFTLISVLVPFSVLAYFTYTHSVRLTQARFGEELLNLGTLVAGETGRYVERLRAEVDAFAVSPFLKQAIAGDETALLQAEAYFASLRSRFARYRELSLMDDKGVFVGGDSADEERSGSIPATEVAIAALGHGEPLLRMAAPVENEAGEGSGYLVTYIGLSVFRPLLENNGEKRIFLVSDHDRLLGAGGAVHSPIHDSTAAQLRRWRPDLKT